MYRKNLVKAVMILIVSVCFSHFNCKKGSNETEGGIKGVVTTKDKETNAIIHPAYIFHNDTLIATTDELGEYFITSLIEGKYTLTCSALNFRDTVRQVKVVGGETVTCNFSLQPDNSKGILVGEFQDLAVFNDSLISNPELAEWNEQQIYNAATGATIQIKWFPDFTGNRVVYLGDDSIGFSDAFGQYAFAIQSGTYCFTGKCKGYMSKTHVVIILPDTKTYLNFFLERE